MEIDIKDRLKSMLADISGNQSLRNEIKDTTDLIYGVGIDSIQMINFILKVEEEFAIEIDFDNFGIENMKNVEIFGEYISNLKTERAKNLIM